MLSRPNFFQVQMQSRVSADGWRHTLGHLGRLEPNMSGKRNLWYQDAGRKATRKRRRHRSQWREHVLLQLRWWDRNQTLGSQSCLEDLSVLVLAYLSLSFLSGVREQQQEDQMEHNNLSAYCSELTYCTTSSHYHKIKPDVFRILTQSRGQLYIISFITWQCKVCFISSCFSNPQSPYCTLTVKLSTQLHVIFLRA